MKIKEFKIALAQRIFSYMWLNSYGINRQSYLFQKIRLNDPVDIPRTIIWGDAVCGSGLPLPKIVWTYWSEESSACAEACQKNWDVYKSEFLINRLTDRSVKEYLPDFPEVPRNVPVQLVSDLIRLMLLERYGGIWMDFSILITRPLDWVVELFLSVRHGVFAFYNQFPDEYRVNAQRPIIDNVFIAAKQGSKFLAYWGQAN